MSNQTISGTGSHIMYGNLLNFQINTIGDCINRNHVNPKKVREIIKNFRPELFLPIHIGVVYGKKWVYDGAHRLQAAIEMGQSGIIGYEINAKRKKDLIILHEQLNENRRKISSNERYHLHLEAGDSEYILINDLINRYGFKVGGYNGDNVIRATSTLMDIPKKYGSHVLQLTIYTMREGFNGQQISLKGDMIESLAKFISIYIKDPRFNIDRFTRQLNKVNLNKFDKKISDNFKTGKELRLMQFMSIYRRDIKSFAILK